MGNGGRQLPGVTNRLAGSVLPWNYVLELLQDGDGDARKSANQSELSE
jgi:hypothetical protein